MKRSSVVGLIGRVMGVCLIVLSLAAGCGPKPRFATQKPKPDVSFKPKEVTDALHAVIAADRAMYAAHVLQRFHTLGIAESSGDWQATNSLPLHKDMLQLAAQHIQKSGAEFHYALRALHPVNQRNLPQTETEAEGLKFLEKKTGKAFYSEEHLGGRRYYTAVYPDKAEVPVCAECHNRQSGGKTDWRLGDVMGGIVVRVPLEF